jgi:ssDNA-binding Zn-finger/Zn-ribbon topoisomerase 1
MQVPGDKLPAVCPKCDRSSVALLHSEAFDMAWRRCTSCAYVWSADKECPVVPLSQGAGDNGHS